MNKRSWNALLSTLCVSAAIAGAAEPTTAPTTEPAVDTHMRAADEEAAEIHLAKGYHLELVASEPDVICPVLCAWDGNGRMYVAEMRSYMLDINGSKAHTPISRVSRWESTKGDGVYDKHTTYVDKMMLPRMVLPLDDRVLIRETDTKDIYSYRDKDGDGVADEKTRVYEGGKQEGNLEHQPSGLLWDVDNWIYVTAQGDRFRFTHDKMEKSPIAVATGQWGLAMTDTGQLIYASAGGENAAHNFQAMPTYGNIGLGGEKAEHFDEVHSLLKMTDVEGGPQRLWPGGGVNHFTGCCGGTVYRGDALPHDLYGDYIIPEPVGRLIRRAKITDHDGKLVVSNPDPTREWIGSTDPNFRPVWTATGPDGYLYICDMYHGIIQEANWTKEGTYLRPQIQKYGLDKNIGRGRIWRLVHDGGKPHAPPHMLDESTAQLVEHLRDPNGWWRDTAQKLIVLRHDLSVVPTLRNMARGDGHPITRLHALWTLDGLDQADDETVLLAMQFDADTRVRAAAIRVAEPRLKQTALLRDGVVNLVTDPDPSVSKQACLTMMAVDPKEGPKIADKATAAVPRTVVGIVKANLAKAAEDARKAAEMARVDAEKGERFKTGRGYYAATCVTCHGPDGMGTPTPGVAGQTQAPPLRDSRKVLADKQLVGRIVLCGLTGPDNGKMYPGQMAGFPYLDDEWIACVLTYVRNDFGNKGSGISPADVAAVRKSLNGRKNPYTQAELYAEIAATAPLLPNGARVNPEPGAVLLEPSTAQLRGDSIRIECYGGGLDIGFWSDPKDVVTWNAALPPGTYKVIARTCTADSPVDFVVDVGGRECRGKIPKTTWEDFKDVPVGEVTVDSPGPTVVTVRPADAARWHSANLAGVRFVPTK